LLSGGFAPGQKITIRPLAAALAVSFTPAREALSRLASEGALLAGLNRSYYVPILGIKQTSEIYRLRFILEGLLAEAAIAHASTADLAYLEKVQGELVAAMDRADYRGVLEHNSTFHFRIYRLADMPVTFRIVEVLWVQIGPSLNMLYPEFDRTRTGVRNHDAALRAMRNRDPRALRRAIEADVQAGFDSLSAVLDGMRAPPQDATRASQYSPN